MNKRYLIMQPIRLQQIDGITLFSDLKHNIGTLCFNYKDEHPYDLATLLDGYGLHCAVAIIALSL